MNQQQQHLAFAPTWYPRVEVLHAHRLLSSMHRIAGLDYSDCNSDSDYKLTQRHEGLILTCRADTAITAPTAGLAVVHDLSYHPGKAFINLTSQPACYCAPRWSFLFHSSSTRGEW
jgi:hypothetical protein